MSQVVIDSKKYYWLRRITGLTTFNGNGWKSMACYIEMRFFEKDTFGKQLESLQVKDESFQYRNCSLSQEDIDCLNWMTIGDAKQMIIYDAESKMTINISEANDYYFNITNQWQIII